MVTIIKVNIECFTMELQILVIHSFEMLCFFRTALAEAEIEYKNLTSPSLYIRFKLKNLPTSLQKYAASGNLFALIWTTTPWTLPANQAICFNETLEYSLIQLNDKPEYYIIGTDLIPKLKQTLDTIDIEEVTTVQPTDLHECTYVHPIDRNTELPFLIGSHVTSDVGTGLVHTAPSHGFDDYLVCLAANISIVSERIRFSLLTLSND